MIIDSFYSICNRDFLQSAGISDFFSLGKLTYFSSVMEDHFHKKLIFFDCAKLRNINFHGLEK